MIFSRFRWCRKLGRKQMKLLNSLQENDDWAKQKKTANNVDNLRKAIRINNIQEDIIKIQNKKQQVILVNKEKF